MSLLFYVFLFSMPIIVFACALIHESGHAIAGIATGGRIRSFLVVPVEIEFRPLAFRLKTKAESGDIGGLVKVDYPEIRRSVGRIFAMIAGGPIANLLVGSALLVWVAHSQYDLKEGVAAGVAWTSIGMGLANLVPCMRERHRSDGLQLIMLLRTRALSEDAASPKSRT